MLPVNPIETIPGTDVYDMDGAKIGRAGTVYMNEDTGGPEWAIVHTGLLGMTGSLVPISQAELRGDRLTVPYSKDHVRDAPSVDPDGGPLSPHEERRLCDHYGLSSAQRDAYGRRRRGIGQEDASRQSDDDMTRRSQVRKERIDAEGVDDIRNG